MSSGALARPDGDVDKNFLAIDRFAYADVPVDEVRRRFQIPDKSDRARAAGSVGPWHPDGISEFQRDAGDPAYQARIVGWATPRPAGDGSGAGPACDTVGKASSTRPVTGLSIT